ncbi:NAD(P)-dependent alcohol dehydrogenase [Nocardioidaceae bacterium]|nr:NAD(P)-dependent alcohol dehydrogenase [Nocardioidaceae bacterium]
MSTTISTLTVPEAGAAFERGTVERRDVRPDDVRIDIAFAGICHSDIHQARDEWGGGIFPMVPGHEIIGKVVEVGDQVTAHQVGDTVGVGCFVDACLECEACKDGEEQYCLRGVVQTYSDKGKDGEITYGGYSRQVVVRDHFVVKIPDGVDLAATTPLLCAGITTYHPLKALDVGKGTKVGVIGMGGLGHVAVKIAAAMGAEVSVLSRTSDKKEDGLSFGATSYYATEEDASVFKQLRGHFDVLINTVGSAIGLDQYMNLLGRGGVMHNLGAPEEDLSVQAFSLLPNRRSLSGSMVGGLPETQEMLDFCAEHGITATIELIDADKTDEYYDKVVDGTVRYRAVIDTSTFGEAPPSA